MNTIDTEKLADDLVKIYQVYLLGAKSQDALEIIMTVTPALNVWLVNNILNGKSAIEKKNILTKISKITRQLLDIEIKLRGVSK